MSEPENEITTGPPPVAEGFFLKLAGVDGRGRITTQDRFINTVRAMLNDSFVVTQQKLLAAEDEIRQLRKALDRTRRWADEDGTVSIVSMIDRVLGGGPVDLPTGKKT